MTKATVCGLLLLAAAAPVRAQAPPYPATPPALPPGPILAVQDFAAWQVVTTRQAAAKPSDKEPSKADASPKVVSTQTITKTGTIRLEVTVDEDGNKFTKWNVEGGEVSQISGQPPMLLRVRPNARKNAARPATSSAAVFKPKEALPDDFPEVVWVSENNFTGITKAAGADYLTFKDRLTFLSPAEINDAKATTARLGQSFNEDNFKEPATAYVNADTHFPVSATRGKDTFIYKLLPAPTQVQTVPPEIERVIEMESHRQDDLIRRPARS